MAIIQRIRTRAGLLLAIVVGVALFAFILGDFITSGGFIVQRSRMSVAEIDGKRVGYPEYQRKMAELELIVKAQYQTSALDDQMLQTVREQAWQELIQQYLLNSEYKKLGLSVSDEEFSDLIQGPNPHPLVMQMFANPQTGTLNRLQLSEFLSNIDQITGESKMVWVFYEKMINNERLFTKYNNLLRKGLYVNKLEAERREEAMATAVDFSYIQKMYTAIPDSTVQVSDSELKKYYKDNIAKYMQDESRDLKYVAFTVKPSEADYNDAERWINDAVKEFKEVEDVEQYINFNSPPYDNNNYKKSDLPEEIGDFMFSNEVGAVYGPYFEDDTWKLAKLAKINYLPDSVRASHILLPASQNNASQMRQLADSLITLAKNGYSWAELVQDNSRDFATIVKGGDLGWFPEGFKGEFFSDTCFYAQVGEVKMTFSDEGFHVVKITDKSKPVKKVQIGVLTREVTPGAETDQKYYSEAVDFASRNSSLEAFNTAVADGNPMAIPVYDVKPLDREIQGLPNSRNIVHWAFLEETKKGDMLKEIDQYGDSYIVAIVTDVKHKGHAEFAEVKDEVKQAVIKEKKAELIKQEFESQMASASGIDDLASKMELPVKTATGVRFTSFSVPGVGEEPKLIAAAVNAEEQILSKPIAGSNGVYAISVENKQVNENQAPNLQLTKSYIERSYAARANRTGFEELKKLADIEDYRYRFF